MSTDLKRRNIPFSPPDMTEVEAKLAAEAIMSGWITTGPKTKEFEKKISAYVNTEKTVCLNSATAAMEFALRLIGVGPEDEVIVPAYTYTASASVTQHVGCKLVMVDSNEENQQMDLQKLSEAITERTKVIVPVDLGGVVCEYDKIMEIIKQKTHLFRPSNELQKKLSRIFVSADCAHSFGAQWNGKMAGEIGDFSSFSFHAVKNLTTAEGGALTWNLPFGNEPVVMDADTTVPAIEGETWNEFLYRKCQLFSLHGQNKDALAKTTLGAWEYDVIGPWYKCNMTDIMAALGLAQMERYEAMLEKRQQYVARFNEAFKDLNVVVLNHKGKNHCSSHHLYIIRLLNRTRKQVNEVITKMAERGIATNVHYKPLPMMTAYKALGFDIKNYPNAYKMFENTMTLPLNTCMTEEDVEYVIKNFVDIVKEL
uniref:DegT/DnrJ/EryC1/StrS family aminotransferase n=1 Tax=Alistipes shahii TaxID=328814 RepID=UPI003FF0C709